MTSISSSRQSDMDHTV